MRGHLPTRTLDSERRTGKITPSFCVILGVRAQTFEARESITFGEHIKRRRKQNSISYNEDLRDPPPLTIRCRKLRTDVAPGNKYVAKLLTRGHSATPPPPLSSTFFVVNIIVVTVVVVVVAFHMQDIFLQFQHIGPRGLILADDLNGLELRPSQRPRRRYVPMTLFMSSIPLSESSTITSSSNSGQTTVPDELTVGCKAWMKMCGLAQ
jgi:hypothetical protein